MTAGTYAEPQRDISAKESRPRLVLAQPCQPAPHLASHFEAQPHPTLQVSLGWRNFSPSLLREMRELFDQVAANRGAWTHEGSRLPIHYIVLRSSHPRYFSLGGDLRHFASCIRRGDEEALRGYSMQCLRMLHDWATCFSGQATTVALVQGRALGGGFEAALSADFLIAEEHAEFGFPEITFGLFPCSGAMSLLARRITVIAAEKMMTSGRIYGAAELLDMGVIDAVCPRGGGEAAVEQFIGTHAARRPARLALQRARRRAVPLDYDQLAAVVDDWVELAMRLEHRDLRTMELLAGMQDGGMAA